MAIVLIATSVPLIRNSSGKDELQNNRTDLNIPAITVASVGRGDIRKWAHGEGTVHSVRRSFMQFENAGKVVFIGQDQIGESLREGMRVKGPHNNMPGQLLAQLDLRHLKENLRLSLAEKKSAINEAAATEASVRQAEKQLVFTRSQHNRYQTLFQKGVVARSVLDKSCEELNSANANLEEVKARLLAAQAQVDQADASANQARIEMERSTIRAPFDGVIAFINVKKGDFFSPESIMTDKTENMMRTFPLVIIDPSLIEVSVDIPVEEGMEIREGQTVLLRPVVNRTLENDSGEEHWIDARVYSVSAAVFPDRRSFRVTVRASGQVDQLTEGSLVYAKICVKEQVGTMVISPESLLFEKNNAYVFSWNQTDSTVQRRDVEIGIKESNRVEIVGGLDPGELVAVKGRQRLENGMRVRCVTGEGGASQ